MREQTAKENPPCHSAFYRPLVASVLAFSALTGSAQPIRFTSLDGSRSLTILTPPGQAAPVRIRYSSLAGTIQAEVSRHKLLLGDLVLASAPAPDANPLRRALTATFRKQSGRALLSMETCPQSSGQMDDVSPIFRAFNNTEQGPALQSLSAFIRDELLIGKYSTDAGSPQSAEIGRASPIAIGTTAVTIRPLDGAWDCTKAILNQIAASGAMVAGSAALRGRGLGEEEAAARAAFLPHDVDEAAELDVAEARAVRDALLEAASGVFLTDSLSWALALATLLGEDDGPEAVRRLQLPAQLLRDAAAAPVDPAGRYVLFRERFADLARLGAAPAARLLDAASGGLALAASLTDSRRNVKLSTEAFALGL
jgi:hypothetical protein